MNSPEKITVAVKNPDGDWLTVELPWDANIDNWIDCFKTVLYWLTFDEETIEEVFENIDKEDGN